MTQALDIGWGKYLAWEGPFFRGTASFTLGKTYTEDDRTLAVITATEGGHFDAINMYDRCILSSGLIQWCEAGQFSVSDMLGSVLEKDSSAVSPVTKYAESVGVDFKKNARGRWRFFFRDGRGEVDRTDEQTQLFLLRSSGLKGTWDDASKEQAKGWAAAVATTFQNQVAQKAQVSFTTPKLMGFVTQQAKDVLWGEDRGPAAPGSGDWTAATRAAYLSFAANLPSTASKSLLAHVAKAGVRSPTREWTVGLLKALTFLPGIAIYPARYDAIRPVLEKLYGVDLPDFAEELKLQQDSFTTTAPDSPTKGMDTVAEIQAALIKLGYDLGPAGADGKYGQKTKMAVMNFQGVHGLQVDGVVGPKTRSALYNLTH